MKRLDETNRRAELGFEPQNRAKLPAFEACTQREARQSGKRCGLRLPVGMAKKYFSRVGPGMTKLMLIGSTFVIRFRRRCLFLTLLEKTGNAFVAGLCFQEDHFVRLSEAKQGRSKGNRRERQMQPGAIGASTL